MMFSLLLLVSGLAMGCGSDASGGGNVTCGALGETCCDGRICDTGTCNGGNGGVCSDCGEPGQACCDLDVCGGSGCCINDICTAVGSTCPSVGGLCTDGSCGDGTCGGPGQPCCGNDTCTAGEVTCDNGSCALCGGPGEPCCGQRECGPDLACDNDACRTCGGPGEPCCPGDTCASGCCDLGNDTCIVEGTNCDSGGVCESGECACTETQLNCGNGCEDIVSNVDQCGACGIQCNDREYCTNSACECRPGFVRNGAGNCIDPQSDPNACGEPAQTCSGGTPVCAAGVCAVDCGGLEECNNACVDTDSSPLHCGGCGDPCKNDEVCVQGNCERFDTATTCNTCPCDADCSGDEACCSYPGDADLAICVRNGTCP